MSPESCGNPLIAGHRSAPARTLVDVLRATATSHPHAAALDDGRTVLSYAELIVAAEQVSWRLLNAGVQPGQRVGVRLPSGSAGLYVAILGVLLAGAAYVPVDVDDPPERAALVLRTARVAHVLDGDITTGSQPAPALQPPLPAPALDDDAWVIFTSGSTGTPKGVAVTHRSAAAFVDAEARLFLTGAPLGPDDRVLAGLSVAFDASCEEMWLAWRHGACLVPAPRALVRSGMDLAPWLQDRAITVVSTVPTLAALWPPATMDAVRLLILGGEACPAGLADRLDVPGRELWNTYGPTETTVVACAARLRAKEPVRIGLPLDGWNLAVLDAASQQPTPPGDVGELVIGGVGLARYLDVEQDRQRFAPAPTLGWGRAYRSGDLVRQTPTGLEFIGRADDQVKVGGRRIELGELDAALLRLPDVRAAAAAVRVTASGHQLLVGYLALADVATWDRDAARDQLRTSLPAALVPLLVVVDDLPVRTSGKIDRAALPWPVPDQGVRAGLGEPAGWLAEQWTQVLGAPVCGPDVNFFDDGGGSLAAAQLVAALRERYPQATVADVYDFPRLSDLAERLDELAPTTASAPPRSVTRMSHRAQAVQQLITLGLAALNGARWVTWTVGGVNVMAALGGPAWLPRASWWWFLGGWLALLSPAGRLSLTVVTARLLLRGVRSGRYPRGGQVHLRLWAAEAVAEALGASDLASAPWLATYARALGAKVGRGVDLHTAPPITGLLTLGPGSSVAPEVDLRGYWVDGDVVRIGRVRVGAGASVGARSVLLPGARVGEGAEVAAGSAVAGSIPPGEHWAGSPAARMGVAHQGWPQHRPARHPWWVPAYAVTSMALAAFPLLSIGAASVFLWPRVRGAGTAVAALTAVAWWIAPAAVLSIAVHAALTAVVVRLLGRGVVAGYHPVRSRIGWQVWATQRLVDDARNRLYPLYASLLTPLWLRALGAKVGRGVEASTVLLLPSMTTVGDHAFLADDTLVGAYELSGGWLRIERAKVGKRAFLGNSGMTGPGRVVPKDSLVAVLSEAPQRRAKPGTSWLGSPPAPLRRQPQRPQEARTFAPTAGLRVRRGLVEACRLIGPVVSAALAMLVAGAALVSLQRWGIPGALLAAPAALALAALVAATVTTAVKWALVGKLRAGEHPLWSSFVWRNELADAVLETVAVPWFVAHTLGTPVFLLWLRSLGAKVGSGVWCESYWLPEADLVHIGDGATVNRGCVLQTHLFHDRIMSMDTVTLEPGATLGPHGVVLPAATLGAGSTVGPSSLVLRGDQVPAGGRWTGNPIAPW